MIGKVFLLKAVVMCLAFSGFVGTLWAESPSLSRAKSVFDRAGSSSPRDLYRMAHEAFSQDDLDSARLYALRIFLDGHRSQNALNLLGAIELKSGNNILSHEWFTKSLSLGFEDPTARNVLARLSVRTAPFPVDPDRLHDHFSRIVQGLPRLLQSLSTPSLHFDAVVNELARGQLYKALALAEEYEKKYAGVDGTALTALCAWALGRNRDALILADNGLPMAPHHPILLFVKAMIHDVHPQTAPGSPLNALYETDEWQKAIESSARFSQLNPRSADGFIVRGKIALELNRIKEARASLTEAGKRDPGNPFAELLLSESFSMTNDPDQAQEHLRRAVRRGYHLPSTSLRAGLVNAEAGRTAEAFEIFQEAMNYRPFTDRLAFSRSVLLALKLGLAPQAREILNEWKARAAAGSEFSFYEAIYSFATGDDQSGINWTRKGFQQNPNRTKTLMEVARYPGVRRDPDLFSQIKAKLESVGFKVEQTTPVAAVTPMIPQHGVTTQARSDLQPAAPGIETVFHIQISPELEHQYRQEITAILQDIYQQIAPYLGNANESIFVNLIPAAGMGSTVAMYDVAAGGLVITTLIFEPDTLRVFIELEKPWLSSAEFAQLSIHMPRHQLAKEVAQILSVQTIAGSGEAFGQTAWIHNGLADILAGSHEVLRTRLMTAQKHISDKEAQLTTPDNLNVIFSQGYSSVAEINIARAQAYLMVASLAKRSETLVEGVNNIKKLIEAINRGASLDQALNSVFGISASQFESRWKEAAYWAMRQGTPYEWH